MRGRWLELGVSARRNCCDWSRCMTNQATLQTHAWKIVLCMAVSRLLLLVLCSLASGEV